MTGAEEFNLNHGEDWQVLEKHLYSEYQQGHAYIKAQERANEESD